MAGPGLIYSNDYMYGKEDEMLLKFNITAAKTVSPLPISNNAVLTTFDAFASQAVIDSFLGTTNEFLLAQFDSTSMGTDAFGGIINMSGLKSGVGVADSNGVVTYAQAASVLAMTLSCASGSNGATSVSNGVVVSTTLSSSTLAAGLACGAYGNIAFRGVLSGIDILTAGFISLRIHWVSR